MFKVRYCLSQCEFCAGFCRRLTSCLYAGLNWFRLDLNGYTAQVLRRAAVPESDLISLQYHNRSDTVLYSTVSVQCVTDSRMCIDRQRYEEDDRGLQRLMGVRRGS